MNFRRPARGFLLATAVLAAAALTVPPAVAAPAGAAASFRPPAAKKSPAGPEDFNGDGIRDLAVAAPGGTAGTVAGAGTVSVLLGSRTEPVTARKQTFHQDSPGVPGTARSGDRFGSALASADLDRDGYADLVVGAYLDATTVERAGSLTVLWGGPQGLSGGASLLEGSRAWLGRSVAVGDFDGDGDPDVAVSDDVTDVRVLSGPFQRDGSAAGFSPVVADTAYRITDLAAGDVDGDGRADLAATRQHTDMMESPETAVWTGGAQGLSGAPKALRGSIGDPWVPGGDSLDIGDIDRDGYADIVVGRDDFRESDPPRGGGQIGVFPGSASGPADSRYTTLTQESPGVPGSSAYRDFFGSGVTVADVDGDGYGDVATGIPGKRVGTLGGGAGAVMVLRGSARGLTGTGAQVFTQDTPGVPGVAETGDRFGFTPRLSDLNGDGHPELAVGGPGENSGAGSVWILKGTGRGPTATGATTFGHGTLGTPAAADSLLGHAFNNAASHTYLF
ncbi:VCBS repeat-containing protein [Streptomyces sp. NPDC000594]|uniref:VCBS repeat-containing protein n=1 Tax=Streptomyces sp. NPDC000594 TaxID=3154261 RepID=UPI0033297828